MKFSSNHSSLFISLSLPILNSADVLAPYFLKQSTISWKPPLIASSSGVEFHLSTGLIL